MTPPSVAVDAWASAHPIVRNRARWLLLARPKQLIPSGDWNIWLYLAGRNAGKTRSAAEDMAYWGVTHPDTRIAVVAPTYSAVRDVCIEGESGLLALLPEELVEAWNRSLGELILTNGTHYKCFSGDEPDRLRGFHHHRAWVDELAAMRYPDAWDQLMLGLTLGEHPQVIVTTTPRPTPLIKGLAARSDCVMVRESTFANAANLSPIALQSLKDRYGGSRMGRQELEALILDDIQGALWTWAMIEDNRRSDPIERILKTMGGRCVVAIDPAISSEEDSDETGIVAAASVPGKCDMLKDLSEDARRVSHGFVLADRSGRYSPMGWAEEAVRLYRLLGADRIVAEKNQGGEMVRSTLHAVDPNVPVTLVHAAKGKRTRAEPISALYEQARVHHIEPFPSLESEMTSWVPGEDSPSRMDACLVAGTLVTTRRGDVPIETIAVGDEALTRRGWRRVLRAGRTSRCAPVRTIQTESGRLLRGTGNHPIWVEGKGFIALDTAVWGDKLLACKGESKSSSKELFTPDIQTHPTNVSATTSLGLGRAARAICIARSGLRIMARCRGGAKSITRTRTRSTTKSPTSDASRLLSMGWPIVTILVAWSSFGRSLRRGRRPRQHGIAHPRDALGTESMGGGPGRGVSPGRSSASSAGRRPSASPRGRMSDSARGVVRAGLLIASIAISARFHALLAGSPSGRTNTERSPRLAHDAVRGCCASGEAPVYNLEVEDCPEYFANGILVHNCVWSLTDLFDHTAQSTVIAELDGVPGPVDGIADKVW